ncbi:MAG: mechanosensitive ion channel family protein [Zoogloeaceae bacterium]|nr:mechanosensitive ion channel family protein [Zoogloeaceae bacterium]
MLNTTTLGNTPLQWLIALCVAVAFATIALTVRSLVVRKLKHRASDTAGLWDDWIVAILPGTRSLLVFAIAAWVGGQLLALPSTYGRGLDRLAVLALLIQGGIWLNRSIGFWLKHRFHGNETAGQGSIAGPLIGFILRTAMWAVILLMLLDNLGFNVTALVASLGVGGVAVALAVQNILGDLFASLSIALDKPFVIGDFVVIDEHAGTIEHVGLKSTRIRSISGEQIIFANADLLKSRIRNYKRMQERRIMFGFGVTYETPLGKLEEIPQMVQAVFDTLPEVRLDRAHFKNFGPASLDFEVVYYVQNPDYRHYMDQQQAINFGIARALQASGIEFAYPTQTLHFGSPLKISRETPNTAQNTV